MGSNIDALKERLESDPTLVGSWSTSGYSGILNGGVWTRPLRREPPGATLNAFYDASFGGKVMRDGVATIVDRGDTPHTQRAYVPSAYESYPVIYLYAGATSAGKATILLARQRIFELLDFHASGWTFMTDAGPVAFVEYVDRLGIQNSEEFPEAVFDQARYRITSRVASLV